jgi:hypothetical protein
VRRKKEEDQKRRIKMSDINEEQKKLYKRAEENDKKILLEKELEELRDIFNYEKDLRIKSEKEINELQDRINKAIDFINSFEIYEPDSIDTTEYKNLDTLGLLNYITNILKGKE